MSSETTTIRETLTKGEEITDETKGVTKGTSSSAKLVKDFSLSSERDLSHYLAITLWLGWMQFYPMLTFGLPFLYSYGFIKVIALIIGAIVLSAMTSIQPDQQPDAAFDLGNWVMRRSAAYLGLRIYHEDMDAIDKEDKCIFIIEPHDVLPIGICGFHKELSGLENKTIMACLSSACFAVPLMRHMYTWLRCGNVGKKSLMKALDAGKSIVVCPGGAQEVIYMEKEDEIILYLKSRFGLVKLALETGTPIVPSFCFNQRKTYSFWVPQHEGLHKFCRKYGFIPVVFFGYFSLPLAPPKPTDLALVTGHPISVPQTNNPSPEMLQKYQDLLIAEMERIFEDNKVLHGMGECSLKVI